MSQLPEHDLEVIGAFVDDALALGHTLSVHDGEAWALALSTDRAAIIAALGSTDADTVRIRRDGGTREKDGMTLKAAGEIIGSVSLVYGNEPGVVISDHTATPEMDSILARANKIGERLYDGAEAADDGQPDEAQEWADYDPDC